MIEAAYPPELVETPTKLKKVAKGELFSSVGPAEEGGSWDWVRFTGALFPCLTEARIEDLERTDCWLLSWRLKRWPGMGTGSGWVSPMMQPQGSKIMSSIPMDSNQPRNVEELEIVWVPMTLKVFPQHENAFTNWMPELISAAVKKYTVIARVSWRKAKQAHNSWLYQAGPNLFWCC